MDQIAEVTGTGKGTLYHYFRHKTEILYEIHLEAFLPQLRAARARAAEDLPAPEQLRLILTEALVLFAAKPHHLRVISEHHREFADEHARLVGADRDEFRTIVSAAIDRGIRSGELGAHDPEIATMMYLGVLNWSMVWFDPAGRLTPREAADSLWSCSFLGLAPRRTITPSDATA